MKEGLSYFTDSHLIVIGLVIFLVSYIVMVGIQCYLVDKKVSVRVANLPFEDKITSSGDNL